MGGIGILALTRLSLVGSNESAMWETVSELWTVPVLRGRLSVPPTF